MQKRHRNTTRSPMTTNPCGSEASPSPESSSSWASSSFSARGADASSTSNRELGNLMKRKELSAAPSAVCPPAGGRNTWCHGTRPGPAAPTGLGEWGREGGRGGDGAAWEGG